MLANANPQLDAIPVDPRIREIVAVCAKHGVNHGEPDDIIRFMRSLHDNKFFAMKFWSVVARVSEDQRPESPEPDWLLETVVEGVTGRTVAEISATGPAHRVLVSKLSSLLAGEDVQPSEIPSAPAAVRPESTPRARPQESEDIFDTETTVPVAHRSTAAALAAASTLPNPLLRQPEPASGRSPDQKLRLVLQPEPESTSADRDHLEADDDRRMVIPLAGYSDGAPHGVLKPKVLAVALALLLIAVFGWLLTTHRASHAWERLGNSARAGYKSAVAAWQGQAASSPSSNVAAPTPVASNAAPAGPTPLATNQLTPHKATAHPRMSDDDSSPNEPSTASANTASEAGDNASAATHDADGRVVVPSTLMSDNLISSRVPVYPDAARANHIEGRVLLQAIVTKDGFVGHLHVIDGDPTLRHAALEAVSTWRYRPYLLNGQPVDVSTTISVDFSGLD